MIFYDRLERKFTQSYSQPANYHFCLETVMASELIAKSIADIGKIKRVADIGAGCGIMGIELAHHLKGNIFLDGIEIQESFRPYFELNSQWLKGAQFVGRDIREYADTTEKRYDLIIGNLPYFDPQKSLLSKDTMRNTCRFWLNGDFQEVVGAALKLLTPGGEAFFLSREKAPRLLPKYQDDAYDFLRFAKFETIAMVRKTHLYRVTFDCGDYSV